jgi:RNA polymerase sigma factor FliA
MSTERPPIERVPSEQLVFMHQGLVRAIARGIHRSFPSYIELDDLIGYGQIGLAQAARDFDPERGMQFSTFAYYRIRGAILDGANQMNWLRRKTRAGDAFERASADLLAVESGDSAGHSPEDEAWLHGVSNKLTVVFLLSQAGDEEREDLQAVDDEAAPLEKLLDDELKRTLRDVIKTLPDDARQLVEATYFEGCTLKEAGERLGISKAWASRLHAKALDQLARALKRSHVCD